jgi:hypothetical protein
MSDERAIAPPTLALGECRGALPLTVAERPQQQSELLLRGIQSAPTVGDVIASHVDG